MMAPERHGKPNKRHPDYLTLMVDNGLQATRQGRAVRAHSRKPTASLGLTHSDGALARIDLLLCSDPHDARRVLPKVR